MLITLTLVLHIMGISWLSINTKLYKSAFEFAQNKLCFNIELLCHFPSAPYLRIFYSKIREKPIALHFGTVYSICNILLSRETYSF